MEDFTVLPAGDGEPEVAVAASAVARAAELLALAAELVDGSADGVIRARIEALMEAKGAEPGPAADWMITSVRALATEMDAVLAYEGICVDRGLAAYWRDPAWRPGRMGQ